MKRSGTLLGFKVYGSRATILRGMVACLSVAFSVLRVGPSAAQTAQPPTLFCESEMALFMAPTEKCYQKVLDTHQRR
jgi:hypothetical protein